jgi:outer membrane biosynthesis protein TonB
MKMSQTRTLVAAGLLVFVVSYSSAQQEQAVNDEDISVSSFEEMLYPALARAAHRESTVVLQAKLDDDGKVVSARAISGSKMLIPDSLSNIRKWRFHPNSNKSVVVIYEFRLVEGRCGPERKTLFVFREPNITTVTTCGSDWQP